MPKRNNHYVPQFYLRIFGVNSRVINLYNLSANKYVPNASIKYQCYARRLYGKGDLVEDALSESERRYSEIIRSVVRLGRLPPKNSVERRTLLEFVSMQWLRTKSRADDMNKFYETMVRTAYEDHPDAPNPYLDDLKRTEDDTILLSLSFIGQTMQALDDLEFHLIYSGAHRAFVTSDAPVVLYNLYNQGIHAIGMLGTVNRGLAVFVPLSPSYHLLLYDPNVYSPSTKDDLTHYPTDRDVEMLNLLQFVFADENVYFNGKLSPNTVQSLARKSSKPRSKRRVVAEIFEEDGAATKSQMVAGHPQIPNLRLALSFLSVRRTAREVPFRVRMTDRYRKELPPIEGYEPPFRGTRYFKRRATKPK